MSRHVKEQFADCGVCPRTGQRIRICYNVFTNPATPTPTPTPTPTGMTPSGPAALPPPTILLVMGLASPAPFWDNAFCRALAAKAACRVVRFDNRDVGLSTHLDGSEGPSATASPPGSGKPDVVSAAGMLKLLYAALQPGRSVVPEVYSVKEMALDGLRLLAALGVVANVHLVGMSLGGMIAQQMALEQPRLVASLTLFSSRSANPHTTRWPSLREMAGLLPLMPRGSVTARYAALLAAATTPAERASVLRERDAERARVYGEAFARFVERIAGDTSRFPFDRRRCEEQMTRVFLRSSYSGGVRRQFLALLNSQSRDEVIAQRITSEAAAATAGTGFPGRVYMPVLIIHGTRDILCPVANGRTLHRLYPGSTYQEVEGMGHTLPPAMRNQFVSWIWSNIAQGESALRARGAAAPPPPQPIVAKL